MQSQVSQYGWPIVFTFLIGYYLFHNVIKPLVEKKSKEKSYKEATDPKRVAALSEDMRRIRAMQQEKAQLAAEEAQKKLELKRKEEMKKKRVETPMETKSRNQGQRLGGSSSKSRESGGFNPMDPSSSSSSGGRYRPTRRSTQRGG